MSFSHLLILGIILIIFIPPEKLPEVMRNIGRMFNDLRRSTSGVWDDIKKEAELRPSDLMKYKPPVTPPPAVTPVTPVADLEHVVAEKPDDSKS